MPKSISTDQVDAHGLEQLTYGTAAFPAAFFLDDLRRVTVPWHWHHEFEFIYIVEGSLNASIGDDTFLLSEGNGYFINSEVLHSAVPASPVCIQECVIFHSDLIGQAESIFFTDYVLPIMTDLSLPYIIFRKDIPEQQVLLEKIHDAWNSGFNDLEDYPLLVRESLTRLLSYIVKHSEEFSKKPGSGHAHKEELRVKLMLSYIEQHYMEELKLSDIALSANISVSEALRTFKKMFSTTPIQYVLEVRLQKACEKLLHSSQSISEIAASCGFYDMSYFTRTFRKKTGMTPSAYRKKNSETDVS